MTAGYKSLTNYLLAKNFDIPGVWRNDGTYRVGSEQIRTKRLENFRETKILTRLPLWHSPISYSLNKFGQVTGNVINKGTNTQCPLKSFSSSLPFTCFHLTDIVPKLLPLEFLFFFSLPTSLFSLEWYLLLFKRARTFLSWFCLFVLETKLRFFRYTKSLCRKFSSFTVCPITSADNLRQLLPTHPILNSTSASVNCFCTWPL